MAYQLVPRRNAALDNNPPAGDAHITTHASDWLWAVFAIMLLSWLAALGWAFSVRVPRSPALLFLHMFNRAASTIELSISFPSSCSQ